MATTQPYLELTDTVSSVKFMDNAATTPALIAAMQYRLSYGGWAPKVARRNQNPFGLPYQSVMEELTIDIRGSTPDVCYQNLQVLNTLLDQGERWYNNEVVNPVFIRYQPLGSTKSTYMQDVVIGGGTDDSTAQLVTLPDDFNVTGYICYLKGVRVRFWRRNGIWLGETETASIPGFITQVDVCTVTWSDYASILSPIDIEFGGKTPGSTNAVDGFLIVTHDPRYIGVIEGAQGVTIYSLGGTTNTADVANFATNGAVGRVTASTTRTSCQISPVLTPIDECEYCAVYATVRNNSTTIDAYLQISINSAISAGTNPLSLQEIKIAAAATPLPQAVFLGIFPTGKRKPVAIHINYRTLTSTASVDFDTVVIAGVNRATNSILINDMTLPILSGAFGSSTSGIFVYHRLFNEPYPEISDGKPPTFDTRLDYRGSPNFFAGSSLTVKATSLVYLATDDTKWVHADAAYGAAVELNMNAKRYKAYLVPE